MNLKIVINFVLFQLGWFACVVGAASGLPLIGTVSVFLIVMFHLSIANNLFKELMLILIAVLIGVLWDSWLVNQAWLIYDTGMLHPALAPHWIIAMWALFATTFNVSLNWLKQRYLLSIVFGAIGGPLAYYAGLKMGAVEMPSLFTALTALAIGWGSIMPLLMFISNRFNGMAADNFPDVPIKQEKEPC